MKIVQDTKNKAILGAVISIIFFIAAGLLFFYTETKILKLLCAIVLTLSIVGISTFNTLYRSQFKNPYTGSDLK